MKKLLLATVILTAINAHSFAQVVPVAQVKTVLSIQDAFMKLVAKKGIKEGFLTFADAEGIVFKPNAVKISDFYGSITKQPGTLTRDVKFARISANGDLAVTAGPYIYQNGKTEDDKVFGEYVSVWRTDPEGKLKLLIDAGIQHPEPEKEIVGDVKDPEVGAKAPNKDPFNGKKIIMDTDKSFNFTLSKSIMGSYKVFFSPEGRFYFPGFEPMTGTDQVLRFVEGQAIDISALTINAGRSSSNDLAYSYGTARIRKGNIVSSFNYVRIWELDKKFKWNILLEIFSAIENE